MIFLNRTAEVMLLGTLFAREGCFSRKRQEKVSPAIVFGLVFVLIRPGQEVAQAGTLLGDMRVCES